MSHEIRTPLNAILGLTEIELQKQLPEDTRRDLEKIHSSGSNLLGIINDILDISKIEAGSFELIPAEYQVPSLINDAVQLNILRIGSKPITFELAIDPTVPSVLNGDALRIKQILNNLLSNAFKYTKAGKVTLAVSYERREKDIWMKLAVRDTGEGIKKKDMDNLFLEYRQLDIKAHRTIEGTGLGLSITKGLLDLMGGIVMVDSEYGRGSCFTVEFPQEIVDETPIGTETAESLKALRYMEDRCSRNRNFVPRQMPKGKVLVVDDVEINLEVAKGIMEPYGLVIDCVTSGQAAINSIREAKVQYQLIFMDQMMPEMDGVEAVRIIRNEIDTEYARTVPIIALTANALVGNEEMFLSNGFNGFISKPIDIMCMDEILNRWIQDN
jgi:CheY-like chemotaxis protein/anti-sigma regulatory factor (Ser/Thr protein kinase)